jgi:hypothetical protein
MISIYQLNSDQWFKLPDMPFGLVRLEPNRDPYVCALRALQTIRAVHDQPVHIFQTFHSNGTIHFNYTNEPPPPSYIPAFQTEDLSDAAHFVESQFTIYFVHST